MANQKFVNFFASQIADVGGIGASDTEMTLSPGDGSDLPSLTGSEYLYLTIVDASSNREVVKVTDVTGDVVTMTRGHDGTIARSFSQEDIVEFRALSISFEDIQDTIDSIDTSLGTLSSQDSDDVDIDGGDIDGVIVGESSASAGTFTVLKATSSPSTDYGVGNRGYNDARYAQIESGTSMLFNQASAPTGWTIDEWAANATVIVGETYGSGGSDSPTSWGTGISVNTHTDHSHEGANHKHAGGSHKHVGGAHDHSVGTLKFQTGFSLLGVLVFFDSAGASKSVWSGLTIQDTGSGTSVVNSTGLSDNFYTKSGTGSVASGGAVDTGYSGTADTGYPDERTTGNVSSSGARTHTVVQDTYAPIYQIVISATKD